MSNNNINLILKEYNKKKIKAELDLERRKTELYNSIPRLEEIEKKLNALSISSTKSILNNDKSSIENLNKEINMLKNERIEILKKYNLDLSFFKPNYSCEFCKDTGYITHMYKETEMCKCLKQRLLNISYDNSNISNISKENFNTFNDNLFSDDVDLSKYKFNISPRKNINIIKKNCIDFVNNFDDTNTKNLLFIGNTGLRKNVYV